MGKKKSTKKDSVKTKFLSSLIVLLFLTNASTIFYFLVINDSVPAEDVPISFDDLMASKDDFIGKTITLDGFLVLAAGNPIMIGDPLVFMNNSLGSNNYVRISNRIPTATAQELVGRRCAVKGVIDWSDIDAGIMEVDYHHVTPSDTEINTGNNCNDTIVDISEVLSYVTIFDPTVDKYAVLFCGGIDEINLYNRYWNDLTSLYLLLLMYGYETANIRVIYGDGTGNDNQIPIDAAADHAGLSGVLTGLQTEMGASDKLFMYITNHGGVGGFSVWDALYAPGGAYPISYSQLNTWLSAITMDSLILISQTCHSGSLIPALSAPDRLLISACKSDGTTLMADTEGPWDEFSFHLFSALLQYRINGDPTPVYSDFNHDGYVSMTEAFNYAAAMDSRPEIPLLDDNGDSVGSTEGQATGGDGLNGLSIFL